MKIISLFRIVRYSLRDLLINTRMRRKLHNSTFSMICCDCTAGCVCKDLKIRMNSPTRNFYFNASDFVKFCKNLDYYLNITPKEFCGNYDGYGNQYLMASLDDLKLFLVHYKSVEEFCVEWERRKVRVNRDNIFFVMNDRNFCSESDIKDFCSLPYKNKVFFSHIPRNDYECIFYIKGSEDKLFVDSLMTFIPKWWIRRIYDQFDWVNWLNSGEKDDQNE